MKKLQLNQDKYYNMHCGQKYSDCQDLKVVNVPMRKSDEIKYLGDWVHSSLNNDSNITRRANKGIGTVSQIMSMLRQVSLGMYHMEIALIFRDSMLVSQMLFSSEIWLNLKPNQKAKLTTTDELYFQKIFSLKRTVAKESIYLETGKYPVMYIIKQRRLLCYYHILQQGKHELISRIYSAQVLHPEKYDFFMQVQDDKQELGINLSDEDIRILSKEKFKSFVKLKIDSLIQRNLEEK